MHIICPQAHLHAEGYRTLQHGAVALEETVVSNFGQFLRKVAVNFH